MEYTEQSIIQALNYRYRRNLVKYKIANSFIFNGGWESDFFIIQRASNYCYEIEVKITRADFLKDFEKTKKHLILSGKKNHDLIPNKFFYCVPEGLISKDEIPPYAGLMYVNYSGVFTVREAPFIHKKILNLDSCLLSKFYNKYMDYKYLIQQLRDRINFLESA